jgi:predicted GH43/DUF377 family glycosyl hydrolase
VNSAQTAPNSMAPVTTADVRRAISSLDYVPLLPAVGAAPDAHYVIIPDEGNLNPGLISYRGEKLLCWRVGIGRSRIFVGRLSQGLKLERATEVNLHECCGGKDDGFEDPRLFVHDQALFVCFSQVRRNRGVRMGIAKLDDDFSVREITFFDNTTGRWEKNWQFFEFRGELHVIYSIEPHRIGVVTADAIEFRYSTQCPLKWLPGEPRGGTPPLRISDEYYSLFHYSHQGCYYGAFYAFEAAPPFRVTRVPASPSLTPQDASWRQSGAKILYPSGAIIENGQWLVSYGWHDAFSCLARFDHREVEASLQKTNLPRLFESIVVTAPTSSQKTDYTPLPMQQHSRIGMAKGQIALVPESAFQPYAVPGNPYPHVYLNLNPRDDFEGEMVIAPHHDEAWLNIHLFKLALRCRERRIRLVSIGNENQLPFFAMFSDAVILQRGKSLSGLTEGLTDFCTDTTGFSQLKNWRDIYAMCKEQPELSESCLEQIVAVFSDFTVLVRESSYEAFLALPQAEPFIWCEIKRGFLDVFLETLKGVRSKLPLVGLDKQFQRNLIRTHGSHFMAIQTLSSLCRGVRFFCGAGSCHVFSVTPVNMAICLGTDRCFSNESAEVMRRFNLNRFGFPPFVFAEQDWGAQHHRTKSWSFDYFLAGEMIEAFLGFVAASPQPCPPPIVSFSTYVASKGTHQELAGAEFDFGRADGTRLGRFKLLPDGRLSPSGGNEAFWNFAGDQLSFYGQSGQLSSVFSRTETGWEGPFLFNSKIRHTLIPKR